MAFGRLERSVGTQPMSDINMTPLIDVMLVLLVIFIITAPLLASAIRLELPHSSAASVVSTPATVLLSVDKSGQAFLNDKPVTLNELAQQLAAAAATDPDTELQLRADTAVPYGRVVELMGVAQKAGLGRIGFIAEPDKPAR
ncbi:MAG: biopolymer transporter ExbD [Burkholderiaceae bacterium]